MRIVGYKTRQSFERVGLLYLRKQRKIELSILIYGLILTLHINMICSIQQLNNSVPRIIFIISLLISVLLMIAKIITIQRTTSIIIMMIIIII